MSTETAAVTVGPARAHLVTRLLRRPEVGAAVAALVVFVFFATVTEAFFTPGGIATWLESASLFGIMAVAVALLMIGGEFDLSTGTMVGSTGLIVGMLSTSSGLNIWLAVLLSLVFALLVGAGNGLLVTRTGLPSFIVTLGTFFVLQGLNLAVPKVVIGQVAVQGMEDVPGFYDVRWLFGSVIQLGAAGLQISIFWWLGLTAFATWVLLRTRPGNWIFSVGGAPVSARQTGVPVFRTKVGLFMTTAAAGWLVGMLSLFRTSTVQASTGVNEEFIYIICAVVGGCLLTGGFGSAIGAALGALIYGMTYQGIVFAQWDNNWLKAFLGVMLLGAVLVNTWVRRQAEAERRKPA
ncbi:MAG: ABC transporter permease [Streptosporangiales bacterium]|nr:ABC transporter permease [Streptosporangiales bacterium]